LEIWGQWVSEDKVSEKFTLKYSGTPSVFEGKTSISSDFDEVKLQLIAADQAGNFGQHAIVYRITE
jgi:hypothetical protein